MYTYKYFVDERIQLEAICIIAPFNKRWWRGGDRNKRINNDEDKSRKNKTLQKQKRERNRQLVGKFKRY